MGPHEVDARALLDGLEAEGHGEMFLADAGRAEEQHVGGVGHEGQCGEFAYLAFICGRLEARLELLQGPLVWQVRGRGREIG